MIQNFSSTYRLQLNHQFGFKEVEKVLDYLYDLGISALYLSPIFKAREKSLHGYDVVDHNLLNPELGTEEDFLHLADEVNRRKMGWLQDFVPNHMAYDKENHLLMDIFENGRFSTYFKFFDIDWNHRDESIRGKVLAPFLGEFYGEALESKKIQLRYEESGFKVTYYELSFPLRIESYIPLLTYNLVSLEEKMGKNGPDFIKFLGSVYVLKELSTSARSNKQRYEQIRVTKKMLWRLYNSNVHIKEFIDGNIAVFNGKEGDSESFNLLEELLSHQMFRFSFWKVAAEEINYRRFFNINNLICLRVEDKNVWKYIHQLIFKFVKEGKISGLRLDHIDGLYDPGEYLVRLRRSIPDTYIVVEKILNFGEKIPAGWPVEGTTGYDFLNYVNGLFIRRDTARRFTRIYNGFTGRKVFYPELVAEKKRLIVNKHMAGNIDNLAHILKRISSTDRYGSDITLYGLRRALVEVMAQFPVYRTYINLSGSRGGDIDYIKEAIRRARDSMPDFIYELNFIEHFFTDDSKDKMSEEERSLRMEFIMQFQQLTASLMAKGFEDTTFYVFNRFISLNEVGGAPDKFGILRDEFHKFNIDRLRESPRSLNTTSTHDTKRGEDVRARLNVLSEMPDEWAKMVRLWRRLNRHKRVRKSPYIPDYNDEYFFYQTLVGALPFYKREYRVFRERLKEYIIKSVREAKVHTAWLKPDKEYEDGYLTFIDRVMEASADNHFWHTFLPFQKKVAHYGIFNSLSQTLLKISSVGVADFYQGTELWDLSLVDPDNRRPVDFALRRAILDGIKKKMTEGRREFIKELLAHPEDGRIKMFLIYQALKLRNEHADIFLKGEYIPLSTEGVYKRHIITFMRRIKDRWVIVAVPRFLTSVVGKKQLPLGKRVWRDTRVVLGDYRSVRGRDAFTGEIKESDSRGYLFAGDIFNRFPVSFLIKV